MGLCNECGYEDCICHMIEVNVQPLREEIARLKQIEKAARGLLDVTRMASAYDEWIALDAALSQSLSVECIEGD